MPRWLERDIWKWIGTPPGNGSQNLVIAKIDNEVDTVDIYTDDESDEANAAELYGVIEDVDEPEYHTDSESEEEKKAHGYVPPTPPRPREEAGAFRVILDHNVDLNLTEYFTESNNEEEDDMKQPWIYEQRTPLDCVSSQDL